MKIAAYQFSGGADEAANAQVLRTAACEAKAAGAQFLVLPEAAAYLREREEAPVTVQDDNSAFMQALREESAEIAIAAGTFELAPDGRAYNTVRVWQDGRELAAYRKLHLYDALAVQESVRIAKGTALPPVFIVAGVSIGVMTCYDLRFPETARSLAERGAEIIIVPAAWFDGPEKQAQWQILCQARAIENGVYLLGADMSGQGRIGHSLWIDPQGIIRAQLGRETGMLTGIFDRQLLESVREKMPLLKQRRFAISPDFGGD